MLAGTADGPEVRLCGGFALHSAVGLKLSKVGLEVPVFRFQQSPSGGFDPTRPLYDGVYVDTEGVMVEVCAACERVGARDQVQVLIDRARACWEEEVHAEATLSLNWPRQAGGEPKFSKGTLGECLS